jgi:hypothetical protein
MAAVSAIMPFYNRHALVRESIESVTEQTFSDFKVIVVDDGSTLPLQRSDLGNGSTDEGRRRPQCRPEAGGRPGQRHASGPCAGTPTG